MYERSYTPVYTYSYTRIHIPLLYTICTGNNMLLKKFGIANALTTVTSTEELNKKDINSQLQETLFEKYINYKERKDREDIHNNIHNNNNYNNNSSNIYSISSMIQPIINIFYTPKTKNQRLETDFNKIFFLHNPQYFFRIVEIAFMVNSLFYALGTYFLLPLKSYGSNNWYLILIVPLFITFPCLGRIVKVASMIKAVTELQLEVIRK